jgi:hypothetical protein
MPPNIYDNLIILEMLFSINKKDNYGFIKSMSLTTPWLRYSCKRNMTDKALFLQKVQIVNHVRQ